MNDKKRKGAGEGVSNTGVLFAKNVGKAAFIFLLLLIATTFVASAQPPCDHNVNVANTCCENTTEGWFYRGAVLGWKHLTAQPTALFVLSIDGDEFDAYCINLQKPLDLGDTFNASIYPAGPTCKNNSIAYILNNWTHSCAHCDNVSVAQSAIWYFWYINDTFCSIDEPEYNHTVEPGDPEWESGWIPNCTAYPEACNMINASINKSVPYDIGITPSTGSFPAGTPIELEATVDYCAGEDKEEVTVVFEADNCIFNESKTNIYANSTINGKLKATLICDASIDSVTVTAQVKDMKWFEIVEPCDSPKQETLGIVNITADDAPFRFYTHEVPALTLPFIIFLAVMMSMVAIAAIRKGGKR